MPPKGFEREKIFFLLIKYGYVQKLMILEQKANTHTFSKLYLTLVNIKT